MGWFEPVDVNPSCSALIMPQWVSQYVSICVDRYSHVGYPATLKLAPLAMSTSSFGEKPWILLPWNHKFTNQTLGCPCFFPVFPWQKGQHFWENQPKWGHRTNQNGSTWSFSNQILPINTPSPSPQPPHPKWWSFPSESSPQSHWIIPGIPCGFTRDRCWQLEPINYA
jgi:hypothetical protein